MKLSPMKKAARENLKLSGHLVNIIFLEHRKGKGIEAISAELNTNLDKELFIRSINCLLTTGKYKSYLHISEADMTIMSKGRKQKKEIIVYHYGNDIGNKKISYSEFIRDDDGNIKFKKEKKITGEIDGEFTRIWK